MKCCKYNIEPIDEIRSLYFLKGLTTEVIDRFRQIIYAHHKTCGKTYPWRETDDPYRILISEIMLQQTGTTRVKDKYLEFTQKFPDFLALAQAPLEEILRVWQGLGYNKRALSLKKTALIVLAQYNGNLPDSEEALQKLPGIGPYTAAAICAFAFRKPTLLIETNIRTVFIHFFFKKSENVSDAELKPLLEQTLDRENPRTWYYALMDYGVMLKKHFQNPSRRSIHYKKQFPFEGSDRQLRGLLLKTIINNPRITAREIIATIKHTEKIHPPPTPDRILTQLSTLENDNLIEYTNGTYQIPPG